MKDIQNSLQLWISIIELWVNVVKDAMISIHCTVNAIHNSIMNIHNSNIDIHDSTYAWIFIIQFIMYPQPCRIMDTHNMCNYG